MRQTFIALGIPFYMFGQVMNSVLRSQALKLFRTHTKEMEEKQTDP